MNSIHDMGGMHGFGAIEYDHDDAPVFDAEWEKRIAGILACAAFNGLSVFDAHTGDSGTPTKNSAKRAQTGSFDAFGLAGENDGCPGVRPYREWIDESATSRSRSDRRHISRFCRRQL